jgi:hypothetical protein
LFSTATGLPHSSFSRSASVRAITSVAPPGSKPTTIFTSCLGKPSAKARCNESAGAASDAAVSVRNFRRSTMVSSGNAFSSPRPFGAGLRPSWSGNSAKTDAKNQCANGPKGPPDGRALSRIKIGTAAEGANEELVSFAGANSMSAASL